MKDKNYITLFMDEELEPIGTFVTPAVFEMDTTHLREGKHFFKLVNPKSKGKKKIKILPFKVQQNRPAFIFVGTKKNQIVDEIIPLKFNPNREVQEDQTTAMGTKIKLMIASFFSAAGLSQL